MENFRCDVEGCLRQSPCEECSLYGVYSSQPPAAEAIRDADSTATHGGNRVFKCSKCGCLLQTDSLIPGVCVQSFITRNSGICGGEYVLQI